MSTINTVKVDPSVFAGSSTSGDSATTALVEALKSLKVGEDMIAITCDTPSEARGYGRRLNKAIEILKGTSDQYKISRFDRAAAQKAHSEGKPIVRYLARVK